MALDRERGFLRDAVNVAVFDLFESLRSRRAILFLVLYMAGSAAASGLFIKVLGEVENAVAHQLAVAQTDQPGAMTRSLMRSEQFRDLLAGLVGDEALAEQLVQVPPMALFYGWMTFAFVPALVTLTSSDAIAGEVGTGSCRFALFRTPRAAWAVGKFAGQAMLMAVGVLAGAVGAFVVGWVWLRGFQVQATALWLLRLGGRGWIHGFAWLGLILGVSQITRTAPWARALSVLALVGGWAGGAVLGSDWAADQAPVIAPMIYQLFPAAHHLDLWRVEWVDRAAASAILLALGALYFTLGHLRFSRRDA